MMTDDYLDELITGIDDLPDPNLDQPAPPIGNEKDLDRMLRYRARALKEIDRIRERFDDEIDRLTRLRDDLLAGEQRTVEWTDATIEGFAREMRASGRKSLTLPHGKVSTRAGSRLEVDDEAETIEWLTNMAPDLIRTKESIDRDGLKKRLDEADNESVWHESGARVVETISVTVTS